MSDQPSDEEQRRDKVLLRLLKTPPQPRPKRERGGKASPKTGEESNPASSGERGGSGRSIKPHG